jgi:hypothetical protein
LKPAFTVYIDESGDEGFRFGRGSSDWFVLSGVITPNDQVNVLKIVDHIREILGREPKSPLHFRDLRHEQKIPYLDCLAKHQLRIVTILVHKPSLKEPEKFQERYRLYFYTVRYLLERVSWFCRDHCSSSKEDERIVEIIFSNRAGMSYDELKNYLQY